MLTFFKKRLFSILFNSSLFLVLVIGIQNSEKKSKVNLLINETVNLPISFIIGTSLIAGSIVGDIFSWNFHFKKKDQS